MVYPIEPSHALSARNPYRAPRPPYGKNNRSPGAAPAQAVFHTARHSVSVRDTEVPAPKPGELLIKAHCSAISPGTESLIFRGGMPEGWGLDTAPSKSGGEFRYPFKYGYALVGEVVEVGAGEDRDWLGKRVFAFHPHQDYIAIDQRQCQRLPEGMPAERALFLANLETALNLVQDAGPLAGERAMVFGQGVVGLLTTALLGQFPLSELITADPLPLRRERSKELGAGLAIDPSKGRELAVLEECLFHGDHNGLDLAIEVSGHIEALNQAIALTGFDGRIVVGSWYGRHAGPVDLGGHFHRRRIRLVASQVGTLNPALSGRWSKDRRLKLAFDWLDRIQPERLITHRFPLSECQQAFEVVGDKLAGALQVVFEYRG
ncbi:zinc-binding dehydrogenase [Methylomagnum ishizawai]|uniref:zinc-binding dehydrogenase n=1 Tax=Methylomagnum ishizawai TaxID=1760988 RepID=UPI001C32DE44|nr:zinc-binding alcohol dehydrogenase [Methylomagnum ishizawai]BBL73363.1 oxidoreductase [Methylomagnum ishizawai]